MSLEIKPGVKVVLHLEDRTGGLLRPSGTILHVSAISIVLNLDEFNVNVHDDRKVRGIFNYRFDEIKRIDPR